MPVLKGELKDEREQNRGPSCSLASLKVEWPDKEASNLLHGRTDERDGRVSVVQIHRNEHTL